MVTDHGAILGVVVERAGEIADWHDERLLDEVMPCPGLCRIETACASRIVGSLILGEVTVGIVTDSEGRRPGCPTAGSVQACRQMDQRVREPFLSGACRRGGRSASSLSSHGQARVQSP